MIRLRRKIDVFLEEWKKQEDRLPLIIKGARQVGKTDAVRHFASKHYKSVVEINFMLEKRYRDIFDTTYEVDTIIKNISFRNPKFRFIEGETLIFFDEVQACSTCATSLKAFKEDGRFDVICSGSLMGINYNEIEANSVGYKEDYELFSLDFEEFLWAKGYEQSHIDTLFTHMLEVNPLPNAVMETMTAIFKEHMVLGGMPAVVAKFIANDNFSGILKMQHQLSLDYREDITKYAVGLDQGRILSIYNKIPVFLGSDSKKFQISKVTKGARNREYIGVIDWLNNAGLINICYCLAQPALPLKGNSSPNNFKIYFRDTGMLIAELDDEAQDDLRFNQNFNTYKGAIYENIIADMLAKQGYQLYFYKNSPGTLEVDFILRDVRNLVPVDVKADDGNVLSLKKMVKSEKFPDVTYGIKLGNRNIGFNGVFYTFPYFSTFLLKSWLRERTY